MVVADCDPTLVLVEGFVLDCGCVSDDRWSFFLGFFDGLRRLLFGLSRFRFLFIVELVEEFLIFIYLLVDLVLHSSLILVLGGLDLHLVLRQPRESFVGELDDLLHFFQLLQRNRRRAFHINHFLLIEVR